MACPNQPRKLPSEDTQLSKAARDDVALDSATAGRITRPTEQRHTTVLDQPTSLNTWLNEVIR